jgi:hypothetical protein
LARLQRKNRNSAESESDQDCLNQLQYVAEAEKLKKIITIKKSFGRFGRIKNRGARKKKADESAMQVPGMEPSHVA